jgi:hypothetical protein
MAMTIATAKMATKCLVLNGIHLVPHFHFNGYYALPGGLMASEAELVRRGAKKGMLMLWPKFD